MSVLGLWFDGYYEPADVIDGDDELVDVPHDELSVVDGICAWFSLLAHDDTD